MFAKKLFLLLTVVLCSQSVWASSDNYCSPTWAITLRSYNRCSNLPLLTPGNDTRVNLKLLMVDADLATLQAKQPDKEDAEFGYGKVPFSLNMFETVIFSTLTKGGIPDTENGTVSYGIADRCMSNESGKDDFIAAVYQSKQLSEAEQQQLTEARKKLNPACGGKPAPPAPPKAASEAKPPKETASETFQQFMRYLAAATAFYEERYDQALADLSSLHNSDQPWLKEASRYMAGRTELNRAQLQAFDNYGYPQLDKADKKALLAAEAQFKTYLKEFPAGRYVASARGLLRRVYWLSNQPRKLAEEYAWQLHNPDSPQNNASPHELALEADSKLLVTATPDQLQDPLLLATLDLSLMRDNGSSGAKQLSLADLKKQQPLFAKQTALFDYLLAAHQLYVQKDAKAALKGLSASIPTHMSYLDFSRLVLRGRLLEATNDYPAARKLWLSLLATAKQPLQNETLQLALALNYEYSKQRAAVFAPDSPITEPAIRSILLRTGASAELLRQVIRSKSSPDLERQQALYTLLYKDLLQGQYREYLKDYTLLPADAATYNRDSAMDSGNKPHLALFTWTGKKTDDSYSCPSTVEIAKKLANNPQDPHGLICLGDFANANNLEPGPDVTETATPRPAGIQTAVLGAAPSDFPGTLFSRGEAYKTVASDASATPDQKAYALYRLIRCYATSGYNHCGGKSVELPERKAWFRTLKSRYARSVWAQSLKYYW
ncbi:outer membrane assembly lipoprotein YfiO [Trichlorobacter lovleyi]|uniref:hypothetical protein n=1 Tax=Trichlorobacter lovleyi TaxID=313985 RepID=UPI00223F7B44|nr:hypothetical protein [Trichlorobacter lovleyi]QOX78146.1 outer membrane assembly lipoprotein YfiO [Trichlorobacter lovleyi]